MQRYHSVIICNDSMQHARTCSIEADHVVATASNDPCNRTRESFYMMIVCSTYERAASRQMACEKIVATCGA